MEFDRDDEKKQSDPRTPEDPFERSERRKREREDEAMKDEKAIREVIKDEIRKGLIDIKGSFPQQQSISYESKITSIVDATATQIEGKVATIVTKATAQKPKVYKILWSVVGILTIFCTLQTFSWLGTKSDRLSPINAKVFDCMQFQWREDGPWVRMVGNSWEGDEESKTKDGLTKIRCKPGCEDICKPWCPKEERDSDGKCVNTALMQEMRAASKEFLKQQKQ